MCDNADYANWSRFPVGTVVRRKAVTSSETGTGTTTSVETFTLKSLTDAEAVVERQNTTERSDGSYRAENPPEPRTYPRQFALPPGMTAADFARPALAAEPAGEETITVLGKAYKASVFTWTDGTESGPMHVKVWLSDEVPGRILRQTMTLPKLKNKTEDEVIEIRRP
jgi:hypothetical protein